MPMVRRHTREIGQRTVQFPLSKHEKIKLGTSEIASHVKHRLRQEFPDCVFSVVTQSYSGGSSITVYLIKADRRIKQTVNEISEKAYFVYESNSHYSKEQINRMQTGTNHQLNQYSFYDAYNPDVWNNGVFLTREGHALLKRVVEIVNDYNFDESDPQTDYFNVNFYLHLELGKWNKPFIDG